MIAFHLPRNTVVYFCCLGSPRVAFLPPSSFSLLLIPPPPSSLLFFSFLLPLPFSSFSFLSPPQRKRKTSPDEASSSSSSSSDPEKDSSPLEKKPKLSAKEIPSSVGASTKTLLPNGTAPSRLPGGKGASSSKVGSKLISKPSTSHTASKLGSGSVVSTVAKKAGEVANTYKTVAEDPSARQVYKSLFNSGTEKRSKEHTSHWVTYFPYH